MTKKVKLAASIGGLVLITVSIIGAGVNIRLSINMKAEENRICELKRDEVIRMRSYINNLLLATFTSKMWNMNIRKTTLKAGIWRFFWKPYIFPQKTIFMLIKHGMKTMDHCIKVIES